MDDDIESIDRIMENDVENRESNDTDGQSRPAGNDDMLCARNEMEDNVALNN